MCNDRLNGLRMRLALTAQSVSGNLPVVAGYAEQMFDALGDPTRRAVFKRLRKGARSVGDIAKGMDISRPAVSQHLKILKEAHLVTDSAEGRHRLYAVNTNALAQLRSWLDTFWDDALAAFKEAAEAAALEERKLR